MSSIQKLLSKREKPSSSAQFKAKLRAADLLGIFGGESRKEISREKEKVDTLSKRLAEHGHHNLDHQILQTALKSVNTNGDVEKALDLCLICEDAMAGIIRPVNAAVKQLGAENWRNTTCWLDTLLFAMFAQVNSYEPLLRKQFEDPARDTLAALLRLWVNMVRCGKLITTDITAYVQEALVDCGWEEANDVRHQDASEAYMFITDTLQLPPITLRSDIFHSGKESRNDDHKLVYERLISVAIPEEAKDGTEVRLEFCMEEYFNNLVEVKRKLSRTSSLGDTPADKGISIHVENAVESPESLQPSSAEAGSSNGAYAALRSVDSLATVTHPAVEELSSLGTSPRSERSGSIFQTRRIEFDRIQNRDDITSEPAARQRSDSRLEVTMKAWQFFSLVPWYTEEAPTTERQLAMHLRERPMLVIALKRYAMDKTGKTVRLNTKVDIPLEIGLPHFVSDPCADGDDPISSTFKLVLKSFVCHRGASLDSGHYIAYARAAHTDEDSSAIDSYGPSPPESWFKFDDMQKDGRVITVDITTEMDKETPYLLFYQFEALEDLLPPYSSASSNARNSMIEPADSGVAGVESSEDSTSQPTESTLHSGKISFEQPRYSFTGSRKQSMEAANALQPPPFVTPTTGRRGSSRSRTATWFNGSTKSRSRSRPPSKSGTTPSLASEPFCLKPVEAPERTPDEEEPGNGSKSRKKKAEKEKAKASGMSHRLYRKSPDRECVIM